MFGTKWLIADEFARHADLYDLYAFVQRRSARLFGEFIQQRLPETAKPYFLEIGCGTGLMSVELLRRFQHSSVVMSDISNEMITKALLRVVEFASDRVEYATLDGEAIPLGFPCKANTLVSAFTLQWFQNIKESVQQMIDAIPSLERLYFSYPEKGSFPEWKHFAELAHVPFTANELPDTEDFVSYFGPRNQLVEVQQHRLEQQYLNAFEFFSNLKHTGAGHNVKNVQLTPAQLRKLMRLWDRTHPEGITVTHNVAFVEIVR